MKELTKFKVLGITLLVTMSSCVAGTFDLSAETLRTYGFELDVNSLDNSIVVKSKKVKPATQNKLGLNNLIEYGRNNKLVNSLVIGHSFLSAKLNFLLFELPQVNKLIEVNRLNSLNAFDGALFVNRAGPCYLLA